MRLLAVQLSIAVILAGQQPEADPEIDAAVRNAVIEALGSKIEVGYVIPEAAKVAVRGLRGAQASGAYDGFGTARKFAEKLTLDLRSSTHDRHLAVFFDPKPSTPKKPSGPPVQSRERFNFRE